MPRSPTIADSLAKLLDDSNRPIYVVDGTRRIAYCNAALAHWIDLERKQIVGRRVEFHSEPQPEIAVGGDDIPLTELCPPPSALAGEAGKGTISCQARDGRMFHRTAEFVPLVRGNKPRKLRDRRNTDQSAVMVLLADADLTAQQLAQEVSGEPNADELHRMIYLFRHGQAQRYSIQSLLGSSPIMRKVRAQVEAAAASLANTLVCGHPGNGRKHVALAIHYQSHRKEDGRLLPIDAKLLTEDLFSRTLERLHSPQTSMKPTLLIENLERMQAQYQSALLSAISHDAVSARIIATFDDSYLHHPIGDKATETVNSSEDQRLDGAPRSLATMDAALLNAISTITIRIPPLADRLEDLPILAQYFLEACNRNSSKQVEALQSDTIDLLALYSWPGGLDQLRETIETAHDACASHAIAPSDLPPFFYQAFHAVAHARQPPKPINLDELLNSIEKEAISRALAQASGNKSEAATLLGMTRPRLYRRLVQLGLITGRSEGTDQAEAPEFIEQDNTE